MLGLGRWPVDAHVHFHNAGRIGPTLDAAAASFRRAAADGARVRGMLLLTQAAREHVFEEMAAGPDRDGWRFEPLVQEPQTVLARKDDALLAVVCGRQVRARAGLEVLALGTRHEFADDQSFEATAAEVRASGALTVLPWGFGKWLGGRGAAVRALLEASDTRALWVGDNGSRLALWGMPGLVRESQQRGVRVLPGTDPFPFGTDYRRVGSFGFVAETSIDEAAPWESLRRWLETLPRSPRSYGRASGPVQFVVNQVGMQVYNRFVRKATA